MYICIRINSTVHTYFPVCSCTLSQVTTTPIDRDTATANVSRMRSAVQAISIRVPMIPMLQRKERKMFHFVVITG